MYYQQLLAVLDILCNEKHIFSSLRLLLKELIFCLFWMALVATTTVLAACVSQYLLGIFQRFPRDFLCFQKR